ncbi:MAG: cytochrome C [Ignavibacteriae bacterium]|nr:cytochrome C [Ignavibacteriota bacterium]NOG98877.1 cytochrome C [Ignavibacteriota bacterium]
MIKSFKPRFTFYIILIFGLAIFISCQQKTGDGNPYVSASSPIEAGRYLAIVGGCNDCHTNGYLQANGNIPEGDMLTGSPMGWRGPWGTTYASNLRITVDMFSEDEFVELLHDRTDSPPMPWMNVNKISDTDARSLYKYIKSLGLKGEAMPEMVPPDKEPETPYILIEPQNLGAGN